MKRNAPPFSRQHPKAEVIDPRLRRLAILLARRAVRSIADAKPEQEISPALDPEQAQKTARDIGSALPNSSALGDDQP